MKTQCSPAKSLNMRLERLQTIQLQTSGRASDIRSGIWCSRGSGRRLHITGSDSRPVSRVVKPRPLTLEVPNLLIATVDTQGGPRKSTARAVSVRVSGLTGSRPGIFPEHPPKHGGVQRWPDIDGSNLTGGGLIPNQCGVLIWTLLGLEPHISHEKEEPALEDCHKSLHG